MNEVKESAVTTIEFNYQLQNSIDNEIAKANAYDSMWSQKSGEGPTYDGCQIFYDYEVPSNNEEVEIGTTEYCNGDLIYEDEIPAIIEEEVVETMDYSSDESNYRLMSCNVPELDERVQDIQHYIDLKRSCLEQSLAGNQSVLKKNRKLFKDESPQKTDTITFDANRITTQCVKFRTTIKIKKNDEFIKMLRRKCAKKGSRGKRKKFDKQSKCEIMADTPENVIESGDVVKEKVMPEITELPVIEVSQAIEEDYMETNGKSPSSDVTDSVSTEKSEFDNVLQEKLKLLLENNLLLFETLESMEVPTQELQMKCNEISDLEKFMHPEFFDSRPTKTPERFLKIRNHITGLWANMKPTYVSRTAIRQGLKNCGDVNCISRIHNVLEQVGAINLGCHDQFKYTRPLRLVWESFQVPKSTKTAPSPHIVPQTNGFKVESRRRKSKSISHSNGHDALLDDTSYTITSAITAEDESVNEDSRDSMVNRIKSRSLHRKEFELVQCQRFSKDLDAPFQISISLTTLLCLYLHALSSRLEIMGFLGGQISKNSTGRDKLSLSRYKPCKTTLQTKTFCEMCPVSQVEQSSKLLEEGYELLGWFHSHPLFPPNPSRTDLKTQTEMQTQFTSNNINFIGFILSCLNMEFKCIYIMPRNIPYELEVEIVDDRDFSNFRVDIEDILKIIDKLDASYSETIEKFITAGNALLQQFSVPSCIEELLKNLI